MLDQIRLQISKSTNDETKFQLGQYLTSSVIANFMSSLFQPKESNICLLDPGAGIGSLTIATVQNIGATSGKVDAWEIDCNMVKYLRSSLNRLSLTTTIYNSDFIQEAVKLILEGSAPKYTHVVMNPPYKKINSNSIYRKLLRSIGIETVNLYSAFIALSIMLTKPLGQIVAIIPRSFCNGPYYKPFRQLILSSCSIDYIHLFDSRNKAFEDDGVLQENIIIKLVKAKMQGQVTISRSYDHNLTDFNLQQIDFTQIVNLDDPEQFIRIPTSNEYSNSKLFSTTLNALGLSVSTGQVVDFRVKQSWSYSLNDNSVPLIYPHNFVNAKFIYPLPHKKPSSLQFDENIKKWLMPNGNYVLIKRFSSKEEAKRVVAYFYDKNFSKAKFIGFENHWNIIHLNKTGIDKTVALGMCCFLNSSLVDHYFRSFSGHTQVNATDLRNIKYPSIETLKLIGKSYNPGLLQAEIDKIVKDAETVCK